MTSPERSPRSRWRWLGYGLGLVVGLVLLAVVALWVRAEMVLHAEFEVPEPAPLALPVVGDSIVAEGERLATLRGCKGCHLADLSGQMFVDGFLLARLPAPNLSTLLPTYSDPELITALRHGLSRDGRRMLAMPSSMFYHLSDADLGAIIAWLRTVPPTPNELGRRKVGLLARVMLAVGAFEVEPAMIDHRAPRVSPDTTDPRVRGEYLARTICTECHGLDLQGDGATTPHLGIVAGYSEDQFLHLMRTGEPIGGRELTLMAEVARSRFVHLTDAEALALHAYLRTLPAAAGTVP